MKKIAFLLVLMLCLVSASALADAPVLTFSHTSGFYDDTVHLEITVDTKKVTIHYTL